MRRKRGQFICPCASLSSFAVLTQTYAAVRLLLLSFRYFSFRSGLLPLQFQRLLGFRSHPNILQLFPNLTLHPLRVYVKILYSIFHSRTESQPVVVFLQKPVHIVVSGFCSECYLADSQLTIRAPFNDSYPEWFLKNTLTVTDTLSIMIPP